MDETSVSEEPPSKIGPPYATHKERVSGEDQTVDIKTYRSGGMARCVKHFEAIYPRP